MTVNAVTPGFIETDMTDASSSRATPVTRCSPRFPSSASAAQKRSPSLCRVPGLARSGLRNWQCAARKRWFVHLSASPPRPQVNFPKPTQLHRFKEKTHVRRHPYQITEIICDQLDVDAGDVALEKSFTDDLGADSLAIVELVLALEESFDIKIPDDEVDNIKTVGDAVNYIKAQKG